MKLLNLADKVIEFSFYALFFLVPLVFWKETSELFEFNKMWLTFVLTIFISFSWITKMIVMKKFWIQKTPLDIPIALFLASQIISTIFSLDPYVSLFGYYSRFNGGLLSIFSYVVLYYAFVSNFSLKGVAEEEGLPTARMSVFRERALAGGKLLTGPLMVKRLLMISLVSATIVALWGLLSHFGYDLTCLFFRGNFDVSCWTSDFLPKIRIFSTLGQPAWLGAYLALLIPIAIAFAIETYQKREKYQTYQKLLIPLIPFLLSILFYVDLLFTKSRAALLGFWISLTFFAILYFWNKFELNRKFLIRNSLFIIPVLTFLIATLLINYSFKSNLEQKTQQVGSFSSGGGGTESGKIRLLVWEGALKIWQNYPLFGSGVETFAYSYYKYRPVAHNLTSEWNYLYNKAHNEYLNFLANTGLFGLGSYLFMIGLFSFITLKKLLHGSIAALLKMNNRTIEQSNNDLLIMGLFAGYISILITNFFGFSVVIINLYLFLIPGFVFLLLGLIKEKEVFTFNFDKTKNLDPKLSFLQKLDIFVAAVVAFYLTGFLINFWLADISYSSGSNLGRAGEYDKAYLKLQEAVSRVPFEPTFKDELAGNDAILATSLINSLSEDEKKASKEAELAQAIARESIISTTQTTNEHQNNIVFWKTKVRIFYTLSQADPKYTKFALEAIKKAQELAPTDAKVSYNLALIYGQLGEIDNAVKTLEKTIELKPNYIDAHYALGLFYRQMATDEKGRIVRADLEQKAIDEMNYILKNIDPNNAQAKEALKAWGGL